MTLVKFNNRPVSRNLDPLFHDFFNYFPDAWGSSSKGVAPVNIFESKDAYELELSAPGRQKEDFKVDVADGRLTISFEKKEEKQSEEQKSVRREFSYESFKRSFSLDEKIDAENISAKYENGVLKLYLPRKEQAKAGARQINVD